MSVLSIFAAIWAFIVGAAKNAPTIETKIVQFADAVTDKLKDIASSDLAKFLGSGIVELAEAIDPALIPLISGIENYLPKLIGLITGVRLIVDEEGAKTITEQLQDAVTALQNIKTDDEVVYAGNLATINAGISNYVISNNAVELGIGVPAPAQLLAAGQVIHAHGSEEVQAAAAALPVQDYIPAGDLDSVTAMQTESANINPADMGASFKDKIAANNAKATEAGKAVDPTNYEVTGDNTGPDTVV